MANGTTQAMVPSLTIMQVLGAFGLLLQIILLWWGADMTARLRAAELENAKGRAAIDLCLGDHARLLDIMQMLGTDGANIRHLMTMHYDLAATLQAQTLSRRRVSGEETPSGGDNPLSQRQGR